MFKRILIVAIPLMILTLMVAQLTSARLFRNTFDADAHISHGGRVVEVVALIGCTTGERVMVEVTLSQAETVAVGRGNTTVTCDEVDEQDEEDVQRIPIRVVAQGMERFEPGPAVASGLAITTDPAVRGRGFLPTISRERGLLTFGERTDVRQWQPADGITLH